MAAFEVSFSIGKNKGKIAFALISLFHVQIQESAGQLQQEHLYFLQNLLA